MVHKIIWYFSQCTDILKGFQVLVIFIFIYFCKYKRLSDENITVPTTTDYSLTPKLSYIGTKTRVEFSGSCLKQNKTTYTYGKIVNIYIVYEISKNYNRGGYSTLENCLFGAV